VKKRVLYIYGIRNQSPVRKNGFESCTTEVCIMDEYGKYRCNQEGKTISVNRSDLLWIFCSLNVHKTMDSYGIVFFF